VEKAEDLVEGGAQFRCHDLSIGCFQLMLTIWQDEDFCDGQSFASKPYDVMI